MSKIIPPGFRSTPGKTHLSIGSYITMLARARRDAVTCEQMCRAVKRKPTDAMKRLIGHMVRIGLLHIASWTRLTRKGKWQPKLRFGPGDSAPYPGRQGSEFGANVRTKLPVSLTCLKHMIDELIVGATKQRLIEQTGVSAGMVLRAIREGRKRGLFYIGAYVRKPGVTCPHSPVFEIRWNDEEDAPRPAPKPRAAIARDRKLREQIRRRMSLLAGNDPQGRIAA